jgi:glycerate 2-kinase
VGLNPAEALQDAFRAAVSAAQPDLTVSAHLPDPPAGRTVVVGAGKAAATMAAAFHRDYTAAASGVVVTRYGHALQAAPRGIRVLEAAHPVPDEAGVAATREVLQAVSGLAEDDLVVCLISGGGSALLCAPNGVTLQEKAALTSDLLRSGADITEMNVVRKHLSAVKGGQLARACHPARVVALVVSDVVGDDLSSIASGPAYPDPSTFADALAILDRFGIAAPAARRHLKRGARGEVPETPKPGDPVFERVSHRFIATGNIALEAGAASLRAPGLEASVTSDRVTGEARDVAAAHAREARTLRPGSAILSGGETTVTVRGKGRGGRNLEFLLALAIELGGEPGLYALAADTDGIDGNTDAAGAVLTPETLRRATALGLNARASLADNDAYGFFSRLGDLVITGPTGTNVNDFRAILSV